MKYVLLFITIILTFQNGLGQESCSTVKFVAGFPDYVYRPIYQGEIYTSAILKLEGDSLIEDIVLSDSLQYLYFLRCYPKKYVICFVGNKQNKFDLVDFKYYSIILFDIKKNIKRNILIPNEYFYKGIIYKLNTQDFSSILNEDSIEFLLTYYNLELPKNSNDSRIKYCLFNPITGDLKEVTPKYYRNVTFDGNSFILKNNNEGLLLLGDIKNNTLTIPADKHFYNELNYIDKLPDDVEIKSNYYAGKVLINNEQIQVLYLYEKEHYPIWNKLKLRVLDKANKTWSYFFIETSIISIKSFDKWIVGNTMVKDAYKNEKNNHIVFINNDWIKEKTIYGPSYASLFDADESYKFYSKGNLFLYNIYSKNTFNIETSSGNSEILLIQDEIIYYRVKNKIYKAPIINGEKLGEPELLVTDPRVPDIHWAFIAKE